MKRLHDVRLDAGDHVGHEGRAASRLVKHETGRFCDWYGPFSKRPLKEKNEEKTEEEKREVQTDRQTEKETDN